MTARAWTKKEVRDQFLDHARHLATYWASTGTGTEVEKIEGALFSLLNVFDGTSMALPAFDLVVRPHPDDKEYHQNEGTNWYEDGMVINDDVHLHDQFYNRDFITE